METKKTAIDELIEQLKSEDFLSDPDLSTDLVEVLTYFMMIESLVPVAYAPQLRYMPAYRYPDLKKFIDVWDTEEAKHGEVLKLYLEKHGHHTPQVMKQAMTFRYLYSWFGTTILSWPLWFISTPVYLIVGGINEATTSAGYWALMKMVENYPFLKKIITAIQAEEVKHLDVYTKSAPEFLGNKWRVWLTQFFLKRNWKPIGSRHGNSSKVVRLLLHDETEDGFYHRLATYLKRVDPALSDNSSNSFKISELVLASIRALNPKQV